MSGDKFVIAESFIKHTQRFMPNPDGEGSDENEEKKQKGKECKKGKKKDGDSESKESLVAKAMEEMKN